jgi:hypothetical protein
MPAVTWEPSRAGPGNDSPPAGRLFFRVMPAESAIRLGLFSGGRFLPLFISADKYKIIVVNDEFWILQNESLLMAGSLTQSFTNSTELHDRDFSRPPHRLDHLLQSNCYLDLIRSFSKVFKDLRAVPERFPTHFFLTKELVKDQFHNRYIVGLDEDYTIVLDCSAHICSYAVVNDDERAKSYHPCGHGHWCCVLGVTKVKVQGSIRMGEFVGVKGDGTGLGIVVRNPYLNPIIGFALETRELSKSNTADVLTLISQDPGFIRSVPACSMFEWQQLWVVWKKLECAALALSSSYPVSSCFSAPI